MRTIYVAIGNSDDKLSQADWADFTKDVTDEVRSVASRIHMAGFSAPIHPWQNACWVFDVISLDREQELGATLAHLALMYDQESIAWAVLGDVTFIKPSPLPTIA